MARQWEKDLKPGKTELSTQEYEHLINGSTLETEKELAEKWAQSIGLRQPSFEEILRRSKFPSLRWEPNIPHKRPFLWRRRQYLQVLCTLVLIITTCCCLRLDAVHSAGTTLMNYIAAIAPDGMVLDLTGSKIPQEWSELYIPSYMPDGFELLSVEEEEATCKLQYTKEDQFIYIIQYRNNYFHTVFTDSENDFTWYETPQGNLLCSYSQNDITIIRTKCDNAVVVINTNVDIDTIIPIFDSLEWKEK